MDDRLSILYKNIFRNINTLDDAQRSDLSDFQPEDGGNNFNENSWYSGGKYKKTMIVGIYLFSLKG